MRQFNVFNKQILSNLNEDCKEDELNFVRSNYFDEKNKLENTTREILFIVNTDLSYDQKNQTETKIIVDSFVDQIRLFDKYKKDFENGFRDKTNENIGSFIKFRKMTSEMEKK